MDYAAEHLMSDAQARVLVEVAEEMARVFAKRGEQNYPLAGHNTLYAAVRRRVHAESAERLKRWNDQAESLKQLTWSAVAEEEFHEAFAEEDPAKARYELVQLAGVVVNAIMSIDRAASATTNPPPLVVEPPTQYPAVLVGDFHVGDVVRNRTSRSMLTVTLGSPWLATTYELVACPHPGNHGSRP